MSGLARRATVLAATAASVVVLMTLALLAWLASLAGAGATPTACVPALASNGRVPAGLEPIFSAAAHRYGLGGEGAAILAGLVQTESDFGRNMSTSSAGAIGFAQFLPATWRAYGVDGDGDGSRDPYNPVDATFSAANYLRASGAPGDWHRALFAYNHSEQYVQTVLERARRLRSSADATDTCARPAAPTGNVYRVIGGGGIVPIPGFQGESIDIRLLRDIAHLVATYRLKITDGYARTGHATAGEHPLGLAIDAVPGPGGSWDDLDRLARLVEPVQGRPRPPFRWVGYDGDKNHGRGNHLHLSWSHSPTAPGQPPAEWVLVMIPPAAAR